MDILSTIFTASTLSVVLMKVTPLLLAALGGAFTQQGNVLNIGLEGMMLIGAFTSVVVGLYSGSVLLGVLCAVLAGLLLAVVFAVFSLTLKADFIVVGIGVNLLAAGLTVFFLQVLFGNPGTTQAEGRAVLAGIPIGFLRDIPVLGQAFDGQTIIVWIALLAVPVSAYVLYRTPYGVHLRAVGEDEEAAAAAGIKVNRVRFISILISGGLSGLAGAQLATATLGVFNANMTAGRGFIAVAALTFGLARPVRTFVAAFIFGAADAVADRLNIAGFNSNLALMMPYVITIVALAFASVRFRRNKRSMPGDGPEPGGSQPGAPGSPVAAVGHPT